MSRTEANVKQGGQMHPPPPPKVWVYSCGPAYEKKILINLCICQFASTLLRSLQIPSNTISVLPYSPQTRRFSDSHRSSRNHSSITRQEQFYSKSKTKENFDCLSTESCHCKWKKNISPSGGVQEFFDINKLVYIHHFISETKILDCIYHSRRTSFIAITW